MRNAGETALTLGFPAPPPMPHGSGGCGVEGGGKAATARFVARAGAARLRLTQRLSCAEAALRARPNTRHRVCATKSRWQRNCTTSSYRAVSTPPSSAGVAYVPPCTTICSSRPCTAGRSVPARAAAGPGTLKPGQRRPGLQ
eukprot:gene7555-biopygen4556